MCLGVPGRVAEWVNRDPIFASARIEFAGLTRICCMACIPEAKVGEYVVVHAGIAISRIDETAAQLAMEQLHQIDLKEDQTGITDPISSRQRPSGMADEFLTDASDNH